MGYLSVWTLVQHLEGYDVSEGGRDRSTGEHVVTHDAADAPPVPGGERVPAELRGDVDDDSMRELWKPELQAKRSTEQLLKDTPQYKKKS